MLIRNLLTQHCPVLYCFLRILMIYYLDMMPSGFLYYAVSHARGLLLSKTTTSYIWLYVWYKCQKIVYRIIISRPVFWMLHSVPITVMLVLISLHSRKKKLSFDCLLVFNTHVAQNVLLTYVYQVPKMFLHNVLCHKG